MIFRTLDETEAKEFRQWARENYVVGMPIHPLWHPIVREEIGRIIAEESAKELLNTTN